jgi:deoxyadenosine/deoxycytidine kinase
MYFEGPPGVGKSYQMRLGEAQPAAFFSMMAHISPDFAIRLPVEEECALVFASEVPENWVRNKNVRSKGDSLFEQMSANPVEFMAEFQAKVLLERFDEIKNAVKKALEMRAQGCKQGIIICERSMYIDKLVFAQAARDKGFFTDIQWADYESLWTNEVAQFNDRLAKHCAEEFDVDLDVGSFGTVYMGNDPTVCLQRIRHRRRRGEEKIDSAYCWDMKNRHENVLQSHNYPARPVYMLNEKALAYAPVAATSSSLEKK